MPVACQRKQGPLDGLNVSSSSLGLYVVLLASGCLAVQMGHGPCHFVLDMQDMREAARSLACDTTGRWILQLLQLSLLVQRCPAAALDVSSRVSEAAPALGLAFRLYRDLLFLWIHSLGPGFWLSGEAVRSSLK